MTAFNTDCTHTELLGQELNEEELSQVFGGLTPTGPWDNEVLPFRDLRFILFRELGLDPR